LLLGLSGPLTSTDTEPRVAREFKAFVAGFRTIFWSRAAVGVTYKEAASVKAEDAGGERPRDLP